MTIQELYGWAKENNVLDYEMVDFEQIYFYEERYKYVRPIILDFGKKKCVGLITKGSDEL